MTLMHEPRPAWALTLRSSRNPDSLQARVRLMGLASLVAVASLTLGASAMAATTGPRFAPNAHACHAKQATLKGKAVIVNCGPATAKVKYNGKTYSFNHGTCEKAGGQLVIDIGTSLIDQGKGNDGFSYASLTVFSAKQPIQVYAYSGKVSVSGSAKLGGTEMNGKFSGTATVANGVSVSGKSLSGTWNCGGVIAK